MKTKAQILREIIDNTNSEVALTMYLLIQMYPELPISEDGSFLLDLKYIQRLHPQYNDTKLLYNHINTLLKKEYLFRERLKGAMCYYINWAKLSPEDTIISSSDNSDLIQEL